MTLLKRGSILLFSIATTLGAVFVSTAHAQSTNTAPGFWNSPMGRPSPDQQIVDLAVAEAIQRSKQGGYGPAVSNTTIGTVNTTTTYEGPVEQNTSGSTNVVQSNSTSNTVTGSGNRITVTTGQTAGNSNQGASSGVVRGDGNIVDLGVKK